VTAAFYTGPRHLPLAGAGCPDIAGQVSAESRRRLVDHHHWAAEEKATLQFAAPWQHPCHCGVRGLEIRARSRSPMAFEPFDGAWELPPHLI
jgi:hypothetical protein